MIYHIVKKENWESCKLSAYYIPGSLAREGYIHCSFEDQVLKVANTLHRGQTDLLVLCINRTKVEKILKIEDLFNIQEDYPHLYGKLPVSAVLKVVPLELDNKGEFIMPNLEPVSSLTVKMQEWT